MNELLPPGVYCQECQQPLDEAMDLPVDQRTPCLSCGSLGRLKSVHSGDTVTARSTLSLKARHGQPGEVAPFLESKIGASFDQDTGRWLDLEQVVDHAANRYRKRLVDSETGDVLRDDDGPLDKHRAHTWRKPG